MGFLDGCGRVYAWDDEMDAYSGVFLETQAIQTCKN